MTATIQIAKTAIVCMMLAVLAGCFNDDSKFRRIALSVDVSPSGDLAAVRYFRDGVETIDLSSNTRKCHWSVGGIQYQGIATFSSSGELVAVGKEQIGPAIALGIIHEISLHDPVNCDRVQSIPLGDFSEGHVLRFSPDDKFMAVSSKKQPFGTGVNLAIIEVESGKTTKKWTYQDADYPSLSLSDDGTMLALGFKNLNSKTDNRDAESDNDTGTVLLMEFPSGDERSEWQEKAGKGVTAIDIAQDQQIVALGLQDGTVKLVHYPTGENRVLHKFDAMVIDVQFSPNNDLIFSSDSKLDGSLVSHRTNTGKLVHNFSVQNPIFDFDLTDEGKMAVIATSSGEIKTVDLGESQSSER